jgi:hypothetical protein
VNAASEDDLSNREIAAAIRIRAAGSDEHDAARGVFVQRSGGPRGRRGESNAYGFGCDRAPFHLGTHFVPEDPLEAGKLRGMRRHEEHIG